MRGSRLGLAVFLLSLAPAGCGRTELEPVSSIAPLGGAGGLADGNGGSGAPGTGGRLLVDAGADASDADPLAAMAVGFMPVQGVPFQGIVAQVIDTNVTDPAGALTATIDWGDGTQSVGGVMGASGAFTVYASHTYLKTGGVTISVTILGSSSPARAETFFRANVLPQLSAAGDALTATLGLAFTKPIATVADANLADTAGALSAAIDWGDGSPASVGVISGASGSFAVSGTHFYAQVNATTLSATGTVTVTDPSTTASAVATFVVAIHQVAITEFAIPTANSGPVDITAGPDGALWFTESQGNNIGRITTAGVVKELAIPTAGSVPVGIAVGPDGALWFAEEAGNQIGRVSIDGVMSELALPTVGISPHDITAGADGALWFAGLETIGRISTTGAYDGFTLPNPLSRPQGITAGPDGALWFTEEAANNIGRISTSGLLTEFALPSPGSLPQQIATGMNGDLAFMEVGKIGQISASGVFDELVVPVSASDFLDDVTVGPDGSYWFTDMNRNTICRLAATGAFVQFGVPTAGSSPEHITVGPDGALWFTEYTGNQIGRIVP